ncbi:uncharacterized protein LOC111718155 isoform X2 [Eurytemora carolleeae]|uniref:uncharacterized protein LOC111718155 isoform X2 n=1 Tax=Eurytemora carolleeae TaxID=1294199 RepID=UPI000C76860C|nr:uncharacterized protein LOC111718155 isoform X2 [Eurytemora carolleeae]|eukprot:XP_023349436.1 uncharacterized protein LOC111718155 isoform X2 [Eurytemora affinis]
MDTASGLKGKKFNVSRTRTCLSRKKSIKTPETVLDIIESFSNQIRKDSLLMIFDEIDIYYGAPNKVEKQDLKNDKDLDNIYFKEKNGFEKETKRKIANEKERLRMIKVNAAYDKLNNLIYKRKLYSAYHGSTIFMSQDRLLIDGVIKNIVRLRFFKLPLHI